MVASLLRRGVEAVAPGKAGRDAAAWATLRRQRATEVGPRVRTTRKAWPNSLMGGMSGTILGSG